MRYISDRDIPDIRQTERILCVQPHYDDNDIGAGGTFASLSDRGVKIYYLTVTDDLVGVIDTNISDQQASQLLKREQVSAGEIIGVHEQRWLGYPDAGDFNYFEMRREIIRSIRQVRPDFLATCDPWLPYEAHQDHTRTGLAVSEASYLHAMPRLKTDPDTDSQYQPYDIKGVIFYLSHRPNVIVDIDATRQRKHRALDCYKAQFTPESLQKLHEQIELDEQKYAEGEQFEFGEAFKLVRPEDLHINIHTWK